MIYKHSIPMSIERSEVTEVHDDYVVIVEYLKPDPNGVFIVMVDYDEPRASDKASESHDE